jgi:alkanesulfonate monooxygenase SsuD/methylene tetrahydromethanopterin reductase-like flavin-dependent oxidoreductase (luciferase family)
MKFGVFDHVDDSGLPLAEHLEARLRIAETYDRLGFHCYHIAEHHGTPLGLAPSPGILFAALSQRTTRLLFGPLVYLLPIYHPLRLVEEVAMLDALSNGRFQLGIGRGVSPIELGFYGLDMAEQRERYDETLAVLLEGLSSEVLDFKGRFYAYDKVPMALRRCSGRIRRCGTARAAPTRSAGARRTASTWSRWRSASACARSPISIGRNGRARPKICR